MASNTEGKRIGDVLKYEAPSLFSRESLTIAANQTVLIGSVLGKNAGGTYEPLNVDASAAPFDNDASAVALEALTTTGATGTALAAKRHCIVSKDQLDYDAATSATVADDALEALGIVVRSEA